MKQAVYNLADKFLKLGILFFFSIFIGRILGPESLGKYSLIMSIIMVFSTFITGGSDILIFRDFSTKKRLSMNTSYSLYIRLLLLILTSFIFYIFKDVYFKNSSNQVLLIILTYLGLFALNANEQFFIARGDSRYFFWITIFIGIPFFILKLVLIYIEGDVLIKFYFDVFEQLVLVMLFARFLFKKIEIRKSVLKFSAKYFFKWLRNFLPLWLNAIAVIFYTKVDQLILSKYLGLSELGRYAASIQIASLILIPISALLSSKLGLLMNLSKTDYKTFEVRIKDYTLIAFRVTILWVIFLYFCSNTVLTIVFGSKFSGTGEYMLLYAFAMIFNCTGMVAGQWIIVEKHYWIPISRSLIGLCLNVILNFFMIPKYGVAGACFSAIITSLVTNFLLYFFSNKGRVIFKLQLNAFKNIFNLKSISLESIKHNI